MPDGVFRVATWLPREWERGLTEAEKRTVAESNVDILLVPENHNAWSERDEWETVASEIDTALYVGLLEDDGCRVGYYIDPRSDTTHAYRKHATADRLAFERDGWSPDVLTPIDHSGVSLGLTVCHDHYFSPLMQLQAIQGADVLLNLSATAVKRRKWGEILQSRAIENGAFTFCTMHGLEKDGTEPVANQSHVFAFAPDGSPIVGTDLDTGESVKLFDTEPSGLYAFDLNVGDATEDSCPVKDGGEIKRIRENTGEQRETSTSVSVGRGESVGQFTLSRGTDEKYVDTEDDVVKVDGTDFLFAHLTIDEVCSPENLYDRFLPTEDTDFVPLIHVHGAGASDDAYRNVYEPVLRARSVEWCAPVVVNTDNRFVGYQLANTAKDTHLLGSERDQFRIEPNRAWGVSSALKPVNGAQSPLIEICEAVKKQKPHSDS